LLATAFLATFNFYFPTIFIPNVYANPTNTTYFNCTFATEQPPTYDYYDAFPLVEPSTYTCEKGKWGWVATSNVYGGNMYLIPDPSNGSRGCVKFVYDYPSWVNQRKQVKLYEHMSPHVPSAKSDYSNWNVEPFLSQKEFYVKFDMWIPSGLSVSPDGTWLLIFQILGEAYYSAGGLDNNPQFQLVFGADNILYASMDNYYYNRPQGQNDITAIADLGTSPTTPDIPTGQWVEFVIFWKESSGFRVQDGTITVWMNNQTIWNRENMPTADYDGDYVSGYVDGFVGWALSFYGYAGLNDFVYYKDVWATSEYAGGGDDLEPWRDFEDGFESGDLSDWNGTEVTGSYALSDNFNDNSIDGAKWDTLTYTGSTVAEANQRLEVTRQDAEPAGYSVSGLITNSSYDIQDQYTAVKVDQLDYVANMWFQICLTSSAPNGDPYAENNWYRIGKNRINSKVYCNRKVDGEYTGLLDEAIPWTASTGVLKIQLMGSIISFYENGNLIYNGTYALSSTLVYIYMYQYSQRAQSGTDAFDDFYFSSSTAWASVTDVYFHQGTYSANVTVEKDYGTYARVVHEVKNTTVTSAYMKAFVRLEDLPDTNNSVLWLLRYGKTDDTFIANIGVHLLNANYYWITTEMGGTTNKTQRTINADTWYGVEFYFNATTNGNGTLWVTEDNGTSTIKMCEISGDFSSVGYIGKIYFYVYAGGWGGSQQSAKTVYFDNVRIDDVRIGWGTVAPFSVSFLTSCILGGQETVPLADIKINGTELTDADGLYKWSNLNYNNVYIFVVEMPDGYYPAWLLNVEGSFSWNGTHYILSHNVTEVQTGYIEIYFFILSKPYVRQTKSGVDLSSASVSEDTLFGDEYFYTVDITSGTGWIIIDDADEDEEPFLSGGTVTGKTYDSTTGRTNITFTTATTIQLLFDRPTPPAWGGGWGFLPAGAGLSSGLIALLLAFWSKTKRVVRKYKWFIVIFIIVLTLTGVIIWLLG